MTDVNIPLLAHQRKFITSEARHPAICGGLGSGKSAAATLRLIYLMLKDPGINTLIGMPTYDLLRLRAMPGVVADLEKLGLSYKANKSDFSIEIIKFGFIYFRSYDRPERWVAFEVAHTILDELDTLPHAKAELVWRKASERTRQHCIGINTVGNVTTPDQGVTGFTYAKWGGDTSTDYELINARTADNFFLPDDYIDQIRANYDPVMADAYINGEFVNFTKNKVYHFFNRTSHHVNRTILPSDKFIYVGLDFNIGGCCAVAIVIESNIAMVVDEFVSHDTADFVNNLSRYKGKTVIVYPDASGRSTRTNASMTDIAMIERAGYSTDCPTNNPAIRDRVNSVNAGLSHNRLLVNTDKCPNLTNALETQGYTDKGEPEKFTKHPAVDDWVDALGYCYNRRYPLNYTKPLRAAGNWK